MPRRHLYDTIRGIDDACGGNERDREAWEGVGIYDAGEAANLRTEAVLRDRRIRAGQPATYAEFLETSYWLDLSAWLKQKRGWVCERCGVRHPLGKGLQVHHKTYAHLGSEYPDHLDDLEVVCAGCHGAIHGIQ